VKILVGLIANFGNVYCQTFFNHCLNVYYVNAPNSIIGWGFLWCLDVQTFRRTRPNSFWLCVWVITFVLVCYSG